MAGSSSPRQSLGHHLKNWTSWVGALLAGGALFAFLLLFIIDLFAARRNPYLGILAYVIAPAFFILGLILIAIGAILQRRRERRLEKQAKPLVINIDFSRARDRRILAGFAFASVAFLFLTAVGSYETYQYTESVSFCG